MIVDSAESATSTIVNGSRAGGLGESGLRLHCFLEGSNCLNVDILL